MTKIIGENGYMEIPCIIPIDENISKGIPYIRFMMKDLESKNPGLFDSFWKYFPKTWLNTYDPCAWNINYILCRESPEDIMVNLTNNAIERLNRTFQSEFKNDGHPSLNKLVEVIQKVS